MNHSIGYIGIDNASNKRVWGYIIDTNDFTGVYAFWGIKTGTIRFARTRNDIEFRKNIIDFNH